MKNMKNEKAVSPVIGVILMVVITVIIAAVLAVFAFGIGGPTKTPQANIKYTANASSDTGSNFQINLKHNGGDPLKFADLDMTIDGVEFTDVAGGSTLADDCDTSGISVTQSATCTPSGTLGSMTVPGVVHVVILHKPSGQVISELDVGVTLTA